MEKPGLDRSGCNTYIDGAACSHGWYASKIYVHIARKEERKKDHMAVYCVYADTGRKIVQLSYYTIATVERLTAR